MLFDYHPSKTLPRLAWCAEITKGVASIKVYHGPWVETHPDSFIAGAWDGDFAMRDLDKTATVVGSGAKLTDNAVTFVTPSEMTNFLYSVRVGDKLIFSNSLVCCFVRAGDQPDLRHPFYLFDFRQFRRWGLLKKDKWIRTAQGNRIHFHGHFNVRVDQQLVISHMRKPNPTCPQNFEQYHSYLKNTIQSIVTNCQHPNRRHRYESITGLSTGYDSVAVSVLASQVGCTQAFSFVTPGAQYSDNGSRIAKILNLDVTVVDRYAYQKLPGMPEAEFCASNPSGTGLALSGLDNLLEGKILFSGNSGDNLWGLDKVDEFDDFFVPEAHAMGVHSHNEFCLRKGAIEFSIPYLMYEYLPVIHEISRSPEMNPWQLGGDYDRPIPRRIAEQAGIPQELFGQSKVGGMFIVINEQNLKPESADHFNQFYKSIPVPWHFRRGTRLTLRDIFTYPFDRIHRYLKKQQPASRLYRIYARFLMTFSDRRSIDWRRKEKYLYAFHWGIEKTRGRYEF